MSLDIDEITDRIRALGRDIAPASLEATQRLPAPLHEAEPYRGVRLTRDLTYGADARHRLDVFAPEGNGGPRPVLLFVHGGGFVGGDKKRPGMPYSDNIALWAVRHGMIGVNMTYRLAPQNPWPAAAEDVAAAVRWVRANAAAHGGDPARVFLMGTSAGAVHVACYVAHADFHAADGPGLAGAIMLSGFYDLDTVEPRDSVRAYFGADRAAYAARSPLPGLLATEVPLMFALAEHDPPDFERQALRLVNALYERNGRWPNFLRLMGHNHYSETLHINTPDDYLGRQIATFVRTS